ncbi:MAG: HPP family protein [bacterium]|nr:HPP family protein [bacterium]
MNSYFKKMSGGGPNPAEVNLADAFWGWLGSFIGICLVAAVDQFVLQGADLLMIIGSFGASAVLIYGAISSPLAQPRNLVGGHVISAAIGVTVYMCIPDPSWLASGVSVSLAIAAMHVTKTVHPPGGATALIAVIGSAKVHALGYYYVLIPVGTGALLMLVVAIVLNNLRKDKQYPKHWF